MAIRGKRIRNLGTHFSWIMPGAELYIGVAVGDFPQDLWRRLGFSADIAPGESLVPADDFGPISDFNANGKFIRHTDKPMETAYRVIEWQWTERHGPYKVDRSDFRNCPYKRYPRSLVPPPGIALQVVTTQKGARFVISPALVNERAAEQGLLHVVNLFLEIFGQCEVLDSQRNPMIKAPIRNLNWDVLPPGKYPWKTIEPQVRPLIDREPKGNRHYISKCLERISSHDPGFVAIGRNGFNGYLVFGFPSKGIFVLESTRADNATYVFGQDWETLSRMTKAEILEGNLQKGRIVHIVKWFSDIEKLLAEPKPTPTRPGPARAKPRIV